MDEVSSLACIRARTRSGHRDAVPYDGEGAVILGGVDFDCRKEVPFSKAKISLAHFPRKLKRRPEFLPMLSTLSVRVRDVGCRDLVPKRHPTCRPTTWMRSDEIGGLSILQVYSHCQHRQCSNRKINGIRDDKCAIWNGVIWTPAKRDGM
jgi:hypothetical protein